MTDILHLVRMGFPTTSSGFDTIHTAHNGFGHCIYSRFLRACTLLRLHTDTMLKVDSSIQINEPEGNERILFTAMAQPLPAALTTIVHACRKS